MKILNLNRRPRRVCQERPLEFHGLADPWFKGPENQPGGSIEAVAQLIPRPCGGSFIGRRASA